MALSALRGLILISLIVFLSACMSGGSAPVDNAWNNIGSVQTEHRVQPGETLYTIAWRYDLDYQKLASWNHLSPPYTVQIGQILRLAPPLTEPNSTNAHPAAVPLASSETVTPIPAFKPVAPSTPAAPLVAVSPAASAEVGTWPWPLKGKVLETFGQNGNKGIDMAVPVGTPVKAVQAGTVVYAGSNLRGYGQLIILRQANDMMTAYAHNSKLLVKMDDKVAQGQTIALSGDTEASQPMLHFEIRKANKSLDPLQYLQPKA